MGLAAAHIMVFDGKEIRLFSIKKFVDRQM
jgi:hypothetical protein